MNHDWFYPAPSMVSSSGDENDVYAAQPHAYHLWRRRRQRVDQTLPTAAGL